MYTIKQVLPCYVSQQCLSLQLQQNTAYVYHLKNSIAFCSALSENKKRGKKCLTRMTSSRRSMQ